MLKWIKYLTVISTVSLVFGQIPAELEKRLSNSELNLIKNELKSSQSKNSSSIGELETSINDNDSIKEISIDSPNLNRSLEKNTRFFGYNFFQNETQFFDNIPTPSNYRLGPGDEITLYLWGETNLQKKFQINKEGLIFYENIGYLNLSNLTVNEAEDLLTNKLSAIYSTLSSLEKKTTLMLEVGKLKSINVYFTGQVEKPGINLIHPFSDVFSALVQAGGVKNSGSLRSVQLIREGKVIEIIDFYSFFNSGLSDFQKTKIINGDIINIPVVGNRVFIEGEVVRSSYYEVKENDSLEDLISYAGGLSSNASSKVVFSTITPKDKRLTDDNAKTSFILNLNEISNITLDNGSYVNVLPIVENDTEVEVLGNVRLPGKYPAYNFSLQDKSITRQSTLKDILDLAGGFDDPTFRKTIDNNIIVLRLDEEQFYGKEFQISYDNADNFFLEINDKIFVYKNSNYDNAFYYTIVGEVNNPGAYPLKDGVTIRDAIENAKGLTELGSINGVSISGSLESFDEDGNPILTSEIVGNASLDYLISDKNLIRIFPKSNLLNVTGNVYNPGLIAYEGKRMTMSRAIELAGGYKPDSLKRNSYVIRANGKIEKANFFLGRAKIIYPGDSIFVPLDPNPDQFNITTFIADLSTTLANLAAILILVDNQNN
jgi:protein involved in polysaccharide export with SLBB domain